MSNVLIGIIGVVLFIGLALAGALLLGSDFFSATTTSKAAATMAQMQQIAAAVNMYQLKTGVTMLASNESTNYATLQPRFLKSLPAAAVGTGGYRMIDATGYATAIPVRGIALNVGASSDASATAFCKAFEEQQTGGNPDLSPKTDIGTAMTARPTAGCVLINNGNYYAYVVV